MARAPARGPDTATPRVLALVAQALEIPTPEKINYASCRCPPQLEYPSPPGAIFTRGTQVLPTARSRSGGGRQRLFGRLAKLAQNTLPDCSLYRAGQKPGLCRGLQPGARTGKCRIQRPF